MTPKNLNDNVLCYLTAAARLKLQALTDAGMDDDLALEVLAQILPEGDLFELPED
jgi:hypothetical protein